MTTGLIELSDHAPQTVAVVHGHVKNSEYDGFLAAAFAEVRRLLTDQHLTPAGPAFARYRPTGVGLDVSAGIPVDDRFRPTGRVTAELLPGGPVVTAPSVPARVAAVVGDPEVPAAPGTPGPTDPDVPGVDGPVGGTVVVSVLLVPGAPVPSVPSVASAPPAPSVPPAPLPPV